MNDVVSPLQSTSYTNRDFISIYEELLDLTKTLTDLWDPSSSNESDPGVVLLKLIAAAADKCNYAIDKSILECFPLSVTQEANARQLFEQLGYYMHWYRSATTAIYMKYIGDPSSDIVTIPKFTMVSDANDSVIYTLIGSLDNNLFNSYSVTDQDLSLAGDSGLSWLAIQGVAVDYEVNGNKLITIENLDANNRLYFPVTTIAENGIFITNANTENYNSWIKKDNLLVENKGNTYYKFGVSKDGSYCYIEFPEDAAEIIKDGIYVTYIKTDGMYGNINAQSITKFYNNLAAKIKNSTEYKTLDVENMYISNSAATKDGENSESINDAYKNYKRTVGTFDTLVTLRDYINYINNSGLVSNCFVCDRNNDIQTSYKIISSVNGIDQTINKIEQDQGVTAYSVKLYLLNYIENNPSMIEYNKSFTQMTNQEASVVTNYLSDLKQVNHDFLEILDPTPTFPHVCYFKNKCPIEFTIIPNSVLTNAQKIEMSDNITQALYNTFNAKEIEFGDEFPYDLVYNTILNSDSHIKNVSLNNLTYETYAVYYESDKKLTYNGTNWLNDNWEIENPLDYGLNPTSPISGATLTLPPSYKEINITSYDLADCCSSNKDLIVSLDEDTYYTETGVEHCYEPFIIKWDGSKWVNNDDITQTIDLSTYGITVEGTPAANDLVKTRLSIAHQIRNDVYVKSVLAGVTQFFVKDETFDYRFDHKYIDIIDNIQTLRTNVDISFTSGIDNVDDNDTYTLRTNEALQFYAPNLNDGSSYSNFVRFQHNIKSDVKANEYYQLKSDEHIDFYWKENEDAIYKYRIYGAGNIIKPSFLLAANMSPSNLISNTFHLLKTAEVDGTYRTLDSSSDFYGDMGTACSANIDLLTSNYILSGSKKIQICEISQFTISNESQEYGGIYWVLNQTTDDGKEYELFKENESTRLLVSGEFLILTNSTFTNYTVLGSGTKIIRSNITSSWKVDVVNSSSILIDGLSVLEGKYFELPYDNTITVTENMFTTLSQGTKVTINSPDTSEHYIAKSVYSPSNSDLEISNFDISNWFENFPSPSLITTGVGFKYISEDNWSTVNEEDTAIGTEYSESELNNFGIEYTGTPVVGDKIYFQRRYQLLFNSYGVSIIQPETSLMKYGNSYVTVTNEYDFHTPSLSDFSVKYLVPGDVEWKTITPVNVYTSDGWQGRSLLGLTLSPNTYQLLLSNQSVMLTKILPDFTIVEDTITGQDKQDMDWENDIPDYYPVCLQSSFSITTGGDETLNTYLLNYNYENQNPKYEKEYLSVYKFSKLNDLINNDSEDKIKYRFTKNGDINFSFTPSNMIRDFHFNVPKGTYLVALKNYANDLAQNTTLGIKLSLNGGSSWETLSAVYDDSLTDFHEQGDYYILINIPSTLPNADYILQIEFTNLTMGQTIQISNCYKYVIPYGFESKFNRILDWINYLDDTHIFMYNISIPDEKQIEDPLDPRSFFNSNHIYSQFIIPEIKSIGFSV